MDFVSYFCKTIFVFSEIEYLVRRNIIYLDQSGSGSGILCLNGMDNFYRPGKVGGGGGGGGGGGSPAVPATRASCS